VLRTVTATRYVTPLREGGSLPAIVEADDDGLYVCKFRGAGQGPKALAAEIVAGELARGLGLPVPELVLVELDPALAAAEPDPEIQDLIVASTGLNLGVDFLPGALPYTPTEPPDAAMAADVVWFDALVTNVDRSWRTPNLLVWHGDLWAIDHGACLYFHHGWSGGVGSAERFAHQPYDASDHVLAAHRSAVPDLDAELAPRVTADLLHDVLDLVPDEWLEPVPGATSPAELRASYAAFLLARVSGDRSWLPVTGAA
jgi:hypothetical protein